ncbi:MAG: hypothetical protein R2710_11035 [Acidimicrobiales bacterium]
MHADPPACRANTMPSWSSADLADVEAVPPKLATPAIVLRGRPRRRLDTGPHHRRIEVVGAVVVDEGRSASPLLRLDERIVGMADDIDDRIADTDHVDTRTRH